MDEAEFDAFVLSASPRLLRLSYLLTGDAHEAEDLLQSGLLRSWRARHRLPRPPDERTAYVRRLLVNEHLSRRRRRWRDETPVDAVPELPQVLSGLPPDEHMDLVRAVARLPTRQRTVVLLRYLEDLSERETAQVMGCRPGTVKSQTSKALASLSRSLGPSYPTGARQ